MQLSEKCRKIFQDAIERYIAEQNQSLRITEKACTPETSEQTTLSTNSWKITVSSRSQNLSQSESFLRISSYNPYLDASRNAETSFWLQRFSSLCSLNAIAFFRSGSFSCFKVKICCLSSRTSMVSSSSSVPMRLFAIADAFSFILVMQIAIASSR